MKVVYRLSANYNTYHITSLSKWSYSLTNATAS